MRPAVEGWCGAACVVSSCVDAAGVADGVEAGGDSGTDQMQIGCRGRGREQVGLGAGGIGSARMLEGAA